MKSVVDYFIRYRSFVGILSLIAVLYFAKPNHISITIGFFFILFGTFFRAWASGYINKNNNLAKDGPYSLTKNPLYFGNFVLGLGIAIAGNTIHTYLIFIIYYLVFFPALMVIEQKRLKRLFKDEYIEWSKGMNDFFPKLKKPRKGHGFNVSLYVKNKEYRVLYFSLLAVGVLILKYLNLIRS